MTLTPRRIDSRIPLALLRAVKRADTPTDQLPDENLASFFPTRLGLSSVVEQQINQFRRLARWRRRVEARDVAALLELISRRPDAGEIFDAAGRELASFHFSGPIGTFRRFVKRLPQRARLRAAIRALRTARGTLIVAADVVVESSPLQVRAIDSLTATIGEDGAACQIYGSLAASLIEMSGAGSVEVVHVSCQGRGDASCVWELGLS